MLRLTGDRALPVAEQQALVLLFVREVLIGRDGILGATDRVDDDLVVEVLDADDVREDVLRDAPLRLRADAPAERDAAVAFFARWLAR